MVIFTEHEGSATPFLARAITASAVSSSEESPSPSSSVFDFSKDHRCKTPGWLLTGSGCSCTTWPDQRLSLRSTHSRASRPASSLCSWLWSCCRCWLHFTRSLSSPLPSSLPSPWLPMSWQHSKFTRFTAPTCCVVYSINRRHCQRCLMIFTQSV